MDLGQCSKRRGQVRPGRGRSSQGGAYVLSFDKEGSPCIKKFNAGKSIKVGSRGREWSARA